MAEDRDRDQDRDDVGGDTVESRVAGNRLTAWLLLDGDRRAVAGLVLAGVFLVIVGVGLLAPGALRTAVETGDPIETVFQGLLTAVVTGVTLVVSINQVVLSQELGAVGDQRDRMAGALEFRETVAEGLEEPTSPPEPAGFLAAVVRQAGARAEALSAAVEGADRSVRDDVETLVDSVVADAEGVGDRLSGASFGTFDVVSAALDYNYSWKLFEARRLRTTHAEAMTEETLGALEDLTATLEQFGPAREHVKTLYFQWALVQLSRRMLATALPALVVAVGAVLYVEWLAGLGTPSSAVDPLVVLVAAGVTVAVAPFAVLVAHVLRIATVAKRTLSIGPFILRESDRPDQ